MITVIQSQTAKLWKILTSATTLETYVRAVSLTWTILQETGRLLWLFVCAILVGFAWLLGTSLWAGKTFRSWTANLETSSSSEPLITQVGKGIVSASKTSVNLALNTAMGQLGFTETPKAIQDVMPSTDVAAPLTPPASLPTAVASAPAPTQPSVAKVQPAPEVNPAPDTQATPSDLDS